MLGHELDIPGQMLAQGRIIRQFHQFGPVHNNLLLNPTFVGFSILVNGLTSFHNFRVFHSFLLSFVLNLHCVS